MKKNKIILKISCIFLLLALLSLNINAAGVSSPYWDENPMYVQSGEVKEFSYTLQNMVGNENMTIKAELEPGTTIMEFTDKNTIYEVPLGRSDVIVGMIVKVPKDAKEGDEWQVGVRFTTIAPKIEGKPVAIGTAFSKGFKVIVGKPTATAGITPTETTKLLLSSQLAGFLALVVILIILLLALRYFHKKRENQ